MAYKGYKTYRQLVSILRDRGMVIGKGSQGSRVMRKLETDNYYNIINGYKDLFIDTPATATTDEKYKVGTTFDEVYALYSFDRELRNIYLKYLLKIENMFKTVISHEFSKQYGHNNYLRMDNFGFAATTDQQQLKRLAKIHHLTLPNDLKQVQKISAEQNTQNITKLIGDIQQEIARQMSKHHQVVTHYMTEHGYIPLWVLVNVLTFGKITYFYQNMKPNDKSTVARQFNVHPDELHKIMEMLGLARNKCAHDERFFDIRFRRSLHTKSIKNFSQLNITRNNGSYTHGTNDAYAIAIIFALFLSKTDIKEFIASMKSAFTKLENQLHTITIADVQLKMGFSTDWKNIKLLK